MTGVEPTPDSGENGHLLPSSIKNPKALREARLAAYFDGIVRRQGGTTQECAVARVIASCFRNGPEARVSTEHIIRRTVDRFVLAGRPWSGVEVCPYLEAPELETVRVGVSAGTVRRVLEMLRVQALTWAKAHVARWHGPLGPDPEGWPRLRPRRHADGSFRLPPRVLRLVGFAASICALFSAAPVALGLEPASRATRSSTDREQYCSAEKDHPTRPPAPSVSSQPAPTTVAASSGSALDLSAIRALVASWPPGD